MTLELPERLTSDDPSDLRNAELFAEQYGGRVLWTKATGWRLWNGRRWEMDAADQIDNFAAACARTLPGYLPDAAANNKDLLGRWWKHVAYSQSAGGLAAMLRKAHSEPTIATVEAVFDRDPLALNVDNGTVDLTTGQLQPHRAADLHTRLVPIPYQPTATAPLFDAFLHRIFDGDADLIRYIWLSLGYTLTGLTTEHCVFFCWGHGKNGKSTLLNTVMWLLGDYTVKIPMEALLLRPKGDVSPNWSLAELPGRRLIVASEIEQGRVLAEATVKDLSGGDPITAQRKFHSEFTFQPQGKLWMYGNHKPILKGSDEGIQRRIKLIPFTQTIPDAEQDRRLPQKLHAELPGILARAVRACIDWQTQGLTAPSLVRDATDAYFEEMDLLNPFLTGYTIIQPDRKVTNKALYGAYILWAEENHVRQPLTGPQFGRSLKERGLLSKPGGGNITYWYGIGLRDDDHTDPKVRQLANVSPISNPSSFTHYREETRNSLTLPNSLTVSNGHQPDPPRCPTCDMPMFKGFQTGRWICGEHPLAEAEL